MKICRLVLVWAPVIFGITLAGKVVADEGQQSPEIVQFGTMHAAIGQQQHQGRVRLGELLKRPHFYGVAALEQLQGETSQGTASL